jgi:molecular chaperone HtpG
MMGRKSMEINPNNKIIVSLNEKVKESEETRNVKLVKDLSWLLYDIAMISSGFTLENPKSFANRIHSLIAIGLNIDDIVDNDSDNKQEENNENTDSNELSEEGTTMENVD